MNLEVPFDSIESAHEFVTMLAQVVLETKRDVDADIQRGMSSNFPRRLKALQIVAYKLETLEVHLTKSRRILNDLRSLRRLLLDKRASGALAVQRTSIAGVETAPSSFSPEVSCSGVRPDSAVARPVSARATVRKRAFSSWREAHARIPGVADAVPWYVRQYIKPVEETTTRKAA